MKVTVLFLTLPFAVSGFNPTIRSSRIESRLFNSRRRFLTKFSIGAGTLLISSEPSHAGEVGARITKAVTQSDLGVSVRRSVVKGAQLIDNLDGKWEKFSDDNGLGSERFKQQPRPKPRDIPDPLPLNNELAKKILLLSDEAFLESLGSANNNVNLQSEVNKVDNLVRKSFERSGLIFTDESDLTAQQFNYYCYTHYKAMCDILVENKLPFNRKKFENALGEKLLPLFAPSAIELLATIPKQQSNDSKFKAIEVGLKLTDEVIKNLVAFGFCAIAERNEIENEDGLIADWVEDLTDLQLSIPLDGDITLSSQVLLQEQGFRIYPDFGRFMITSALQQSLGKKQSVSSDEYYMDTGYSSDPSLFEAKQVLINIVIDSA